METKNRCRGITSKGEQCRNYVSNGLLFCHAHINSTLNKTINNMEDIVTLSQKEIQLLSTYHDKNLPNLSPIGRKRLTHRDIEVAIKAWRKRNGNPQLPKSPWWQRTKIWQQGPHLGGADLANRDFSGFDFEGVVFSNANIENTILEGANLKGAWLSRANLARSRICSGADASGAVFFEANLTETEFHNANLSSAYFTGASLEGTRLLGANLNGAYFYRARLNNTELMASQLGEAIGEEHDGEYHRAIEAYSRLKSNFEAIGRMADAGWAYKKERRMKKMFNAQQAKAFWKKMKIIKALNLNIKWLKDWFIELLCDYGESAWRVIFWMAMLFFIIGPILMELSGGIILPESNSALHTTTRNIFQKEFYKYLQYLLHMVDTFTTADYSKAEPANDLVRLISGFMSMIAIFLLGLLGFVAGNRIRNS